MILQFPTPYPGELLYSTLGRYHLRSGNVFWKHTLEDLFGKRTVSATALLPSGIRSLIKRLPPDTTIDERTLIYEHTLFSFYTSLLPKDKAFSIYESMLSEDGKKIYMQSGIMASSIPQNKYFKYCPACLEDDTYGEMYWQRIQQLPGKLICSKHGLYLEDSSVPIIHSNKHNYILPNESNCDLTKVNPVDEDTLQLYLDFLVQAERVLNGQTEHKTFTHFTEFYRKYLIEKGFASINGRVNQRRLHEAFRDYYSDRFLESLCIDVKSIEFWLASITRKHRKSFHPYYHILLLNFLGLDVDDIFREISTSVDYFGKPRWPCLNIVCPNYKKDVIPKVSVRTCEKTKLPIGRFDCPNCGFSYTRKGKEQTWEDRYNYTRIMEFGFLWKKELLSLLGQSLSYREIARKLHVDANTVIKYEKVLKCESNKTEKIPNQTKGKNIESHRQIWLQIQQEYPNQSKTELRHQIPSTYIFLYRHDREWLDENSPKPRIVKVENKRVNWQERDEGILQRIQIATEEIKSTSGKTKRITLKSLSDAIGERALLERHLDKMPSTKAFIEQVRESDKEFRLRRVRRVIKEMNQEGKVIRTWEVVRRAGIKSKFYHEVIGLIHRH
ncbi:TnsD family Tn7-like transposition protein [Metabacillus idriensis]|uniref:TnsD family Tn7-like transposition protein n=1 Tax=Metabacillus idriensis TaxID=324768 RepID=UPI00174A7175|nr:TnsD family Tn7-like transposition protein [Metabacillus idriensis]